MYSFNNSVPSSETTVIVILCYTESTTCRVRYGKRDRKKKFKIHQRVGTLHDGTRRLHFLRTNNRNCYTGLARVVTCYPKVPLVSVLYRYITVSYLTRASPFIPSSGQGVWNNMTHGVVVLTTANNRRTSGPSRQNRTKSCRKINSLPSPPRPSFR